METENEKLLKLQEKLSGSFMSFSDVCQKLQKTSNNYVEKLNKDKPDVNIIQKSGVGLIHMLKTLKGDMSSLLESIENDFEEFDPKRSSQLFEEIFTKLLKYKTTIVGLEKDNGNISTRLCDKETVTEENNTPTNISSSTSDLDQTRSLDNSLVDCEKISTNIHSSTNSDSNKSPDVISINGGIVNRKGCSSEENNCSMKSRKRYTLSLRVVDSDEQDTDDSWKDSLTSIKVKTKLSPKRESRDTEEDANDSETVDFNREAENTPDDIFEDFKEESKSPVKSKEIDMLFPGDIKEEPSISLKSEETDMIFSEDSPPNATNPETPDRHENGKSSESVTNLEIEDLDNLLENDETKKKDESRTNFKNTGECNKSNLPSVRNRDEKLSAPPDSNRSRNNLDNQNGKVRKPDSYSMNHGSHCVESEDESDCSFETVKCSNNDSQSPDKATETGSKVLKIPVKLDESSNDSEQSSGSSYTIDSNMQITKKTQHKSAKEVSSSQDLDSPENSQELENHLVESDSGNITNSQESKSSEGTEISTASFYTSSENTETHLSADKEDSQFIRDRVMSDKLSDNATPILLEENCQSPIDSTNSLEMKEIEKSQDAKTEETLYEVLALSVSAKDSSSCDSGNPQSDIYRIGKNSEDEEFSIATDGVLNSSDERARSPNLVNIEYQNRGNDEVRETTISNLNNSDELVESTKSKIIECQLSSNNDDEDSAVANLKYFDEQTESTNSETIEYQDTRNDEDEESGISHLNDSVERVECQDKRNDNDDLDIADMDDFDENTERSNSESEDGLDSSDNEAGESAIAIQNNDDNQKPNSENLEYSDNTNEGFEDSAIANLNYSDDRIASPNSETTVCQDSDEQTESSILANIECSDGSNELSTISHSNNSDKQKENQNSEDIEFQPIRKDDGEESNTEMQCLNSDKIEYRGSGNEEDSESTIDNIDDCDEPEECPNAENIDSDATDIIDNETVEIGSRNYISLKKSEESYENDTRDFQSLNNEIYIQSTQKISGRLKNKYDISEAENEDIHSMTTQVLSTINELESKNIGDDEKAEYVIPNRFLVGSSENSDSKCIETKSDEQNNEVLNEISDIYSLATQKLSVMETNNENQSKSNNEELDLNAKGSNDVNIDIENPFSVETVKLVSDEDVDVSDSQSSRISEKYSDLLTEHNYSCASASDHDDSMKNNVNPEIEDGDISETGSGGLLNGDVDKEDSKANIDDSDSDTININTEAETDENRVTSPNSYLETNVNGDDDTKNSQSELIDIVDTSYIYSEHNYSSGGSPGHQNYSSDTEDEGVENSCKEYVDREKSTDVDSDETDIDKKINEDFVGESEDMNLIQERDLANLDEIPDSQEDVALSQQSTNSYEFDISENFNCLGEPSDRDSENKNASDEIIDITQKDEIGTEDIVKELESLLSEDISDRKSEGHIEQHNAEDGVESSENNNEKEKTVLFDCNVESTESLLDITMEEFLSDFQKDKIDSQATIILDDNDVKPKLEVIQIEENDLEEPKPLVQKQNDIGDEILELLKEVPIPTLQNADVTKQPPVLIDDADEFKEAEDILKMMEKDSSDDSSESDDTDDGMHLLSDTSIEGNDEKDRTKALENKMTQALAEHNMVGCYVDLERLPLPKNDFVKYTRKLEDNIDWLCDLTTLNKRKCDSDIPFDKPRGNKKMRTEHCSTGHSSSSSSDDSDLEVCGYRSGTPVLPKQVGEKLDAFLANEIFKNLDGGNDVDSSHSGSESDDSSKKKQKNKTVSVVDGSSETNNNCESDTDTNNERTKISIDELQKKAWKHNPLLRGKLSDSDTGSGTSDKSSKKKKKRRRYELECTVLSDNLDSDSDLEGVCEKNKSKLEEKLISPIKRNIPSSDSSESDSDIEFVPPKIRTPLDGEVGVLSPSQKGRRNIRALMSQESYSEATKRANKEEQERIERLKDRHKVLDSFSQSFSQSQSGQEEDTVPFVLDVDEKTGEPLIEVNAKITAKLKPHQITGIRFMWDSCYESVEQIQKSDGSGCILAHCMGLGKTLQVITLIDTLFAHEKANTKHVLVVCPLSTVNNWKREVNFAFEGFSDERNFSVFSITGRNHAKYETVREWQLRKKAILILGYESFQTLTNENKLDKMNGTTKDYMMGALIDPGPDLVICDEGHLLRNKKALKTMALSKIKSKRRIILTGTPLQNNLLEYYHMVQFVKPDLLGNLKEFKTNFENPITNGQYEDSTKADIKLMMERTHVLHRLLMKTVQRIENTELEIYLPKMMDHALFIQLSQTQVDLYNEFSRLVQSHVDSKQGQKGVLADYQEFQYLCTHPHILAVSERMKNKRIKERDVVTNEEDQPICSLGSWWKNKIPEDSANKIEYGNKLVVLRSIIEACEEVGDKVLVFSQSYAELDFIELFLKTIGTSKCASWQKKRDYSRMDGTVNIEERSVICDKFNDTNNKTMRLLLMSTKVGGLGLNLTAANRVIIMTVNWNPSYDTQSVFRTYRFGQQKEVYVYRLISLGTMEEKVYHRTLTKLAVFHRVIDKHQVERPFRKVDLLELYSCKPTADEERPTPNVPEDQMLAKVILRLPCIFKFHEHKALLANRPEDNLTEQELTSAWEAWQNNEKAAQAPPKAQTVPTPKTQSVLPPKTQSVPPPKTQSVPPPKNQSVPPPNTLASLPYRTQTAPSQKNKAVPLQRTPVVPLQGTQAATPPMPSSMAAMNFGVGRSNLNQIANANLSRVAVSNVPSASGPYFIPKESNVILLDIPNPPDMNLQTSNARNSRYIGKGANQSANLGRMLAPTAKPATSTSSNQVVHEVNEVVVPVTPNGHREQYLNSSLSPTIPVGKKICVSSKNILNMPGAATEGTQRKISPLTSGLTNIHQNIKKLHENSISSSIANLPKGISIVKPPPLQRLTMESKVVPWNTRINDSRVNKGGSSNEATDLTKIPKNANSAPFQKKKDTQQRLSEPPNNVGIIKKKSTNENSVPSRVRRNPLNKRKLENHPPSISKKKKVATNAPSSDHRDVQTIVLDDLPREQKKNSTGSSSDSSRVASINLDDDGDVALCYDNSSESASLSSVINNLKLSGVTVRMAQGNPNDIITLD